MILTEPANGLDAVGIQKMRALIRGLAEQEGKTVFLSSHLLHEVQLLCDRVAIISAGSVVHEASVAELLHHRDGFRLEARPLEAAEAVLASRWGCRRHGEALLVAAARGEAPEVVRALVAGGVDVLSFAPEQRNLEEVFLSMTQKEAA